MPKKLNPKVTVVEPPEPKTRVDEIISRALQHFLPPPKLKLSEFAEKHFSVTGEFSSIQGLISLRLTPYMREILDCVTDPHYHKITWLSSAQSGKTTATMIIGSYYIQHEPSPILFLEPNEALAQSISNERFSSVVKANPRLKELLNEKGAKNNTDIKVFPGGILAFGSAGSFNDLISRPIRILILDEVDAYNLDLKQKGNPLKLAEDRTLTFHNRKIITCSTPGTEGMSNITEVYQQSDMRVYEVPCPHCHEYLEFALKGLKWAAGSDGKGAWYECPHCKQRILEQHRASMVSSGRWTATQDGEPGHAGFRLNQFNSLFPNVSFQAIAMRFVQCSHKNDINDLKVFTNQVLAETWNDQHLNNVNEHELAARAEYYPAEVPMGVGVLCTGVDFQADRAEISVWGFGKMNQAWLINHQVIHGDPAVDPDLSNASLYHELELYLNKPFKHGSGREIYIRTAFLDVGDSNRTTQERKFCFQRTTRKLFPCMGSRVSTDDCFSGKHIKDHNTKRPVYYVGTINAKDEIYHRLQLKFSSQGGYIHFPKDMQGERQPRYSHINDDYFKQLTSEKLIEKKEAGVVKRIWVKKPGVTRNEALDCFVYALAAFKKEFGLNLALLDDVVDFLATPFEPEETDLEPEIAPDKPLAQPQKAPPAAPLTWAQAKAKAVRATY